MNSKFYTGLDFCVAPSCIDNSNCLKEIAKRIAYLLKFDDLSEKQMTEIEMLKQEYAKRKGE